MVLGRDLLGLGLPGEHLLGGEAEFLYQLPHCCQCLCGFGFAGVFDLLVEGLLLCEEFCVGAQ